MSSVIDFPLYFRAWDWLKLSGNSESLQLPVRSPVWDASNPPYLRMDVNVDQPDSCFVGGQPAGQEKRLSAFSSAKRL